MAARYKAALESVDRLNLDPYQLLLAQVAEHPQDTEGTFDLLMRVWEAGINQEESRDARSTDLLRYLIGIGAIQAADIERFRDELTDHVRRPPRRTPSGDELGCSAGHSRRCAARPGQRPPAGRRRDDDGREDAA